MTSVPYPTFSNDLSITDRYYMSCIGRCRISFTDTIRTELYNTYQQYILNQQEIYNHNNTISSNTTKSTTTTEEDDDINNKRIQKEIKLVEKKYNQDNMKIISNYIMNTCQLDTSIIDIELYINDINDIINTSGLYIHCILDSGCSNIVLPYTITNRSDIDNDNTNYDSLITFQNLLQSYDIPRERCIIQLIVSSYNEIMNNNNINLLQQLSTLCHTICINIHDINTTTNTTTTISITDQIQEIFESSKTISNLDIVIQMNHIKLIMMMARQKRIIQQKTTTQEQEQEQQEQQQEQQQQQQQDKQVQILIHDDEVATIIGTILKSYTPNDRSNTTISLIDPTPTILGLYYTKCIKTDRIDLLYPTVVCTRTNEALGLVYSSKESIISALQYGKGIYYSRSRQSLWKKGDTSGHDQTLHRIDIDCDGDAIRFIVTQNCPKPNENTTTTTTTTPTPTHPAFCHLNTLSCWGPSRGIRHLEQTLQDRLHDAPIGSYTQRLFNDSTLLRNKLVEEVQELSEANTKQHVAEELADVLYFSLVHATQYNVTLEDAVIELDRRSKKVTRRPGNSKAYRIDAAQTILSSSKKSNDDEK